MKSVEPDAVCITGVGVGHALGLSWDAFCQNLAEGRCGIAPLPQHPVLSAHDSTARMFSWLPPLPPSRLLSAEKQHLASGLSRLALHCAEEAVDQASGEVGPLAARYARDQIGVILGSGFGNLADLDPTYRRYFSPEGKKRLSPLTIPVNMGNSAANLVSQALHAEGPSYSVSSACSSGLNALTQACEALTSGRLECVVTGGLDLTVCPSLIDAWDKMRVLSTEAIDPTRACRPLEKDRPGLVLAEGGVMFVLEKLSSCRKNGVPILGVVEGWHENCDAFDLVAPRAETQEECVRRALGQAGHGPGDIDLIHLHATGTEKNDRQELEVMEQVFGSRIAEVQLAAIKSQIGHTMGASGTFSLAAALSTLNSGKDFPWKLAHPDWPSPLTTAWTGVSKKPSTALINCFAFGGTNCCIVLTSTPN